MRSGILASSIGWPCGFSPAASRARAQSRRIARNLAMVRKMSAEAVSEKPMQPARRGKRHARLRQRAPIADAGAKREGQFLGGGAAGAVPGVAAGEEGNEGREALADMERGVHVIGEECGLLRRTLAAQRERRQRIEPAEPVIPLLSFAASTRPASASADPGATMQGASAPRSLLRLAADSMPKPGIEADGQRARAIAGPAGGLHLRRGQRLHHIPAPRAVERRPGLGLRIERLGCEPLMKLGAQRIERRLGQRLAGKGKPFGLGALRKSGGE